MLSIFGTSVPFIHESGTIGILFSLGIVVIAALKLVLDFDFIDKALSAVLPSTWSGTPHLASWLHWSGSMSKASIS